ncbi:hypothetical protein OJP00_03225 [Campylobacter lari]|uniref:hypothetical protein n=1 Tax=Campylobacter lari TaxID=201 RepID=UPI0021F7BEC0|nr:hypothetical protein [Campylobacter lari]MCW0185585.1 hypothetical protein [Campylobacter lari]
MSFKSYSELFLKISQNNYKVSTHYKVNGIIKNRLSYFFEYDISEIKPSIIKNWISNINDVSIKSKKALFGYFKSDI